MSNRIARAIEFQVEGDGSSTTMTIDLREHLESKDLVGGFSPSGVENAVLKSNRNGTTTTIGSISVANFIVSIVTAAAFGPDVIGFALTFTLLFEGAV